MDLRLFPLQTVLFPSMRLPIHIFEERYRLMISECIEESAPFGVLLIKSGPEVGPGAVPFDVGTTARILNVEYLDDGRMNLLTIGERRFRTVAINTTQPYLRGEVALLEPPSAAGGMRSRSSRARSWSSARPAARAARGGPGRRAKPAPRRQPRWRGRKPRSSAWAVRRRRGDDRGAGLSRQRRRHETS